MARRLRFEFEGAIYHITARGNERSDIFKHERDCERFLEKLEESVGRYHIRMYAYVLMKNHIHLLLETPRGNVSSFMQQLNTSYTMYYNTRHERTGHLFSGRYKTKLVEGDEYLLKLTRYIHLNPVKVKRLESLELAERLRYLRKYKWSTYRAYAGLSKEQEWVDYGPLSAVVWERSRNKALAYRRYVEGGLAEDDRELQEVIVRSSRAIGTISFCRWVEEEMKSLVGRVGSPVDVAMRRIECGMDPDDVIGLVCETCGKNPEYLQQKRSLNDERLLAILLLEEYTGLSQRAIGQKLGLQDGSGLIRLKGKLNERLAGGRKLRKLLKQLRRKCTVNH